MRTAIFGFNQAAVINYSVTDEDKELKCDLTDLLLLDYLIYAQASPKMLHIEDNGVSYVWLQHEHILEDLPILYITTGTLRNRLSKLRKMELIQSKTIANQQGSGTRTYYAITSFLDDMLNTTTSLKNDVKSVSHHSKMTSNTLLTNNTQNSSILSKDNITTTDLQKFDFGKPKQKKKNLYQSCVELIMSKTNKANVQDSLFSWLDMLLEKYRATNRNMYVNIFKGKLKKLDDFPESDWVAIIDYATRQGYENFYALPTDKRNKKSIEEISAEMGIVKTVEYTEEEKEELRELTEERIRNGQRAYF